MDFWASRKGLRLISITFLLDSVIFNMRLHRSHPSLDSRSSLGKRELWGQALDIGI